MAEREHMDYHKGIFQTPFGPMDFTINSGYSVYISAGSSYDKSPDIIVNGIPYYANAHLQVQEDGSWGASKSLSNAMYLSRKGSFLALDTGSPAAKKKAFEGILLAWEDFIFGKEILMLEGELVDLNNNIKSADEEVAKEEEKLDVIKAKRQKLQDEERGALEIRSQHVSQGGYPEPEDWDPRRLI